MLLEKIQENKKANRKSIAVLLDPDKWDADSLQKRVELAEKNGIDFFFVGGSLVSGNELDSMIEFIQEHTSIPTIIFPGSAHQISSKADAILFLSLLSGRNPEFLIGNQVVAAPYVKKAGLEVISTGYLLIDGGVPTTANYMSNSLPIPNNKPDIASATALAGEMLGFNLIYLDAGSGAALPVSGSMIESVANTVHCPVVVGGGITGRKEAEGAFNAGADLVVVGNAVERNPEVIVEIAQAKSLFSA